MIFRNRRKQGRKSVKIPISLSTVDTFLDSEIMNLSKGGIFLRADLTFPVGTEVDLKFALPSTGREVSAVGTVVWSRRSGSEKPKSFPNHPAGMGIQFKEITTEDVEEMIDEIEGLFENTD